VEVLVNLSIFNFSSNFSKSFIFNIIVVFIVLFTTYTGYIICCKPEITKVQNQWQKNFVVSQRFIYRYLNIPKIILGSSLAARIDQDVLPADVYNLGFSGGSVLTGLELLVRSGAAPKIILIETNVIFNDKDEKMLDRLFAPLIWKIKKTIPSLQAEYQPLNIILSFLYKTGKSTKSEQIKRKIDQNTYTRMLALYKEKYSTIPEPGMIKKNISDLQRLVSIMIQRGTKVVFFEMPIASQLSDSKLSRFVRKTLKCNFNAPNYTFIKSQDLAQYRTTDGIHLTYQSMLLYANELIQNIMFFQ